MAFGKQDNNASNAPLRRPYLNLGSEAFVMRAFFGADHDGSAHMNPSATILAISWLHLGTKADINSRCVRHKGGGHQFGVGPGGAAMLLRLVYGILLQSDGSRHDHKDAQAEEKAELNLPAKWVQVS